MNDDKLKVSMDNLREELSEVFCLAHPGLREASAARDMSVLEYVARAIRNQISDDTSNGNIGHEMSRKIEKFMDQWEPL
jgi:hypothetical protein